MEKNKTKKTNLTGQALLWHLSFRTLEHSDFGFVSSFEFSASNFLVIDLKALHLLFDD